MQRVFSLIYLRFQIGINWDQKERVFRNFAGLIGTTDTPTLVHRWTHGKHFYVRIVWIDPMNVIAGKLSFCNGIIFYVNGNHLWFQHTYSD